MDHKMDPAPLDITWGSDLPVKAGKQHKNQVSQHLLASLNETHNQRPTLLDTFQHKPSKRTETAIF
jgi:hypothetical protein